MPDRAVVDVVNCDRCGTSLLFDPKHKEYWCDECETWAQIPILSVQTRPRALVALSDDRQWLVVLTAEPVRVGTSLEHWWNVHKWNPATEQHEGESSIPDTGQDAHDVLREFLEGA